MDLIQQNNQLKDALRYLLETKKRKDEKGKDEAYNIMRLLAWKKAEETLKACDSQESTVGAKANDHIVHHVDVSAKKLSFGYYCKRCGRISSTPNIPHKCNNSKFPLKHTDWERLTE